LSYTRRSRQQSAISVQQFPVLTADT